ncbi:DUF1657 domain-containing protein [Aliibacillus thermotolerans]|uniref:DUF1657 domain-containing protein n=1 Tax=Aliibacillus thermotolerans TaxID=1834418 RepID=A0ABW0UA72_9BACI|nr:DUF1657 domain-containing protein [Aliibacillus thermotolerans]MDA3129917.1 DUF1657 domain-containing protein [Aliibacillus thermotolerans]
MTVATQIQQAIASCESTLASLHSFALETNDQAAKQMFQNLANQQEQIMMNLKARQQFIENEEPQYKEQ